MEFVDSNRSLGALERRKSFSLPSLNLATTEKAPLRQNPSSDFIHTSGSHSPPTTDSMVTLGEWVAESRREMMQQMDIEEDRPASNESKPFSLCLPFIKRPISPKSVVFQNLKV
ncbi:hypothetical protein CEXT_566571 [Caerostris extrusa]|uniref:Uncharacterized protein n=1 Tax=Caerostris extrusa TaxID=172846 RepID=A0AAV4XYM1_CAEEX|nr:hypothetical protein CEXT_566571 [Caerostris extrusa]